MPNQEQHLTYDELVQNTAGGAFHEAKTFLEADDRVNYLIAFHETHGAARLIAEATGVPIMDVMTDIASAHSIAFRSEVVAEDE